MQPATTAATQIDATKAINTLRKRLNRWELNHLRTVAAELAERLEHAHERIEALETEVSRAWDTADGWRMDAVALVNDLQAEGQEVGLTQDGQLVVMSGQPTASDRTNTPTAQEHQAAALVMECFGTGSPEALRFAQHIVERNGLRWLADDAPTATYAAHA